MDIDLTKCSVCGATKDEDGEEIQLKKCIMCFKMFCEDCAYFFGGREFCSRQCADFFFYGVEESKEESNK